MLINWQTVTRLCPEIISIIHVGAYTAEERKHYGDIRTRWVEADPELFDQLQVDFKYHFAATDYKGKAMLNLCPFRAANLLLEPNLNKRRSDVYVEDTIEVPADRIDSIQEPGYNFLNLDIQGAELNALKGTDLEHLDYIYTECHRVETYVGCTQVEELDDYLEDFTRVITEWTKYGWGDALYIRKQ